MLKKKLLTGALTLSLVLGMNSPTIFAACESDASYEWVRMAHKVHHVMLNEIATGGEVAKRDAKGQYNATAYSSAFTDKNIEDGLQGKQIDVMEETNAMFETAGDDYVRVSDLGNAIHAYTISVYDYWNTEQGRIGATGKAKWSEDGTTHLGSTVRTLNTTIVNNAVDWDVVGKQKVKELANQFKQQSDDPFELADLVAEYMVDNIKYGADAERKPDYNTVYGALVLGEADCTGYALTFNAIMNELGIPTMNVKGFGHIWNRTKVDGQWYYTDITWSDTGDRKDWVMLDENTFNDWTSKYSKSGSHEEMYLTYVIKDIAYSVEFRNDQEYEAGILKNAGLFMGDARGFRLSDSITRAEMASLLVRVVGATDEVANNSEMYSNKCTFTDVPNWAKPSVGYCLDKGLVAGIGNGLYGSNNVANKLDFCTVLLRALGDSGVQYNQSDADAVELGYLEYGRAAFADLNRADVVNTVYNVYKAGAIR